MNRRLLLASDFDGTAADIRTDPRDVVIDAALVELFRRAEGSGHVTIALISGRDIEDLTRKTRGVRAWLAGAHGLDVVAPDGTVVRQEPGIEPFVDSALQKEILECGLRLERKKHGTGLHWRGVDGVDASHPVVRKFREVARSKNLELIDGRAVVEARTSGPHKGDALRLIASLAGARRVVFAGDDLTDVDACRAADRGIFLASAERAAPEGLEAVSSRDEIIRIFEEELSAARPAQMEESWPLNR